jgi:hypothetical protein
MQKAKKTDKPAKLRTLDDKSLARVVGGDDVHHTITGNRQHSSVSVNVASSSGT